MLERLSWSRGSVGDGLLRDTAGGYCARPCPHTFVEKDEQPAFDQPLGRRGLHQAARARPAGELQPPRHDHPVLGGHDIEALAFIGADLMHGLAAARADRAFRSDRLDDARQMLRKRCSGTLADAA